ncbi:MAG: hypothetical protein K5765_04705 [Clostridia bacterium]|nr:hypothetical protein [Clostridia bacterium]
MYTAIAELKNEMVGKKVTYDNADIQISQFVKADGFVTLNVHNQINTFPQVNMYVYVYCNNFENENVGKVKGYVGQYKAALGVDEYEAATEDLNPNNFIYNVSVDHSLGAFDSMNFSNTEVSDNTKAELKTVFEHYAKGAVDWFVPALQAKCGEYII